MSRLNGYLHRINAAETDQCACKQEKETVEHFLLRCKLWETQRQQLLQLGKTRRGNLSYLLGGKTRLDNKDWTPNMKAVQMSIDFAINTGRLDTQITTQDTQGTQSTQDTQDTQY